MLSLCKKEDPTVSVKTLKQILCNLEYAQIIAWEKPAKTKIELHQPKTLGVWLHTTNQCNLKCEYCYVHKSMAHMNLERGKQIIAKILTNAKEHQFETVKFKYSGGEVLLRFDEVMKLVTYGKAKAREIGIKSEHVLLTNAVLLTPEKAKVIKKAGIRVMVSLDGLKKHHDQIRIFPGGMGSFQYVWQGISILLRARVPFNVSVTVTKKNAEGIPELIQKMLNEKIPFVFNFFRENCEAGTDLMAADKYLIRKMKKAYQMIENNLPEYPVVDGLLDRVSLGFRHLNACGVGRNYLVVNQLGNLASCQVDMNRKIGSIDDPDPIQTMINNNFVIPKGLTVNQKNPCSSCLWRYACGGGCPLITKSVKGQYNLNSPYCEVYKSLIPPLLRLEAKRLLRGMKC